MVESRILGVIASVALVTACSGTSVPAEDEANQPTAGAPSGAGAPGGNEGEEPGSGGVTGAPAAGGGSVSSGAGGAPTTSIGEGGPCTVLTPEAGSYSARLLRTLLPPASAVAGIASEGSNLWLSSADHNHSIAEVTRYAVATGEVITQFQTADLFSASGTGAYGIEVSERELLVSVSGNENQIVRLDRESGAVLGRWGSPSELGPSDLAWLGDELLISTGTGKLYAANLEPPASIREFTSWVPDSGRDTGVATCNGVVVWAGLFSGISVLSASGDHLGSISREGRAFEQSELGRLAFYGDLLVIASTAGLDFYALQPSPQ
jgi:hypothetical protein